MTKPLCDRVGIMESPVNPSLTALVDPLAAYISACRRPNDMMFAVLSIIRARLREIDVLAAAHLDSFRGSRLSS